MELKHVEIRDRATHIPALAFHVVGWRAGFGPGGRWVVLIRLEPVEAHADLYEWPGGARTMRVAHQWLEEHWDEHEDGGVVDVEFILGETASPKKSELS